MSAVGMAMGMSEAPEGMRSMCSMRFELLGPLRALHGSEEVPLGPPKQRAVLAVLLLQEGRPISYEGLVEAVWGDEPPAHVRNLVQKYVSGVRRAFACAGEAGPALTWTGSGYRLSGGVADDLRERRRLVDAALAARDAGQLRHAGELIDRAEALWRGEFAEGLNAPHLTAERLRWREKRLTVLEAKIAGEIELGRSFEYVHELIRLVAAHPLRERLVELLMNALYRTGRSSDALIAFEAARHRIADTMGADPGPALRSLHERMLRQDPELLATRAAATPTATATAPTAPHHGRVEQPRVRRTPNGPQRLD
ncbi:BTAD domain-containing putative transcriptional regulator [Streptomyces sp. NPDC048441]|uniref:AfsR/SARP family transcriptional regulator n=1 Tax=Streptomyces sp. NPDC048441 TaxID=3365552 RepID=UPI0037163DD5